MVRGRVLKLSTSLIYQHKRSKGFKRWVTFIALGFGVTGVGCCYYYSEHYYHTELSNEYFTKYRISYKKDIDESHFLLELTPLKPQRTNLWSAMASYNLWSVEVKQPDIMVVRRYTPLPLEVDTVNDKLEVLKDGYNANGKLLFYIKNYENGEVSKWLRRLPTDRTIEVRGPYVDYEFPRDDHEVKRSRSFLWEQDDSGFAERFNHQPFDISMFTAGTAIVTALQLLLTEDPFKGKIQLFHSCKDIQELGPLIKFLYLCEQKKRLQLHMFESSKGNSIRYDASKIEPLISRPCSYVGSTPFTSIEDSIKPVASLVCGPDGYITTISGMKYDLAQGPICGLLGSKGWNNFNVYKL
ncbi:oxidoreductase Ecym_5500 [Eremothecium cymbalariae DBVPG|uniref:Flavoprotein pyridine nucleotide cytochrome reductase-like FAD-binding domain-containing protein n=1 Tax=Eremothecium cymbalariae (strain CBS 270.75 / DBVPG 7215 / KCTC 17166 / NRRL Y-17582) TaxID=931890 RepID=I6NDV1_ERECY|nr:hypothetical protein Ecym_5500 [Eremothecium cymbalariae DBVPG\